MRNKSGLMPLGSAVLVEPYKPEVTIKSKLIHIPVSAREKMTMAEQSAIVVAIGPDAWKGETVRAKPGDHVMISAYAGMLTEGPKDGKQYRVINARDIFLRIEHPA